MNLFSISSLSFPYQLVLAYVLSYPALCTPMDCVHQASLSLEFSSQEYWSGLPFPSPGDLPDPGIKCASLASPALAGGFFTTEPPGKHIFVDSRRYMLKYH